MWLHLQLSRDRTYMHSCRYSQNLQNALGATVIAENTRRKRGTPETRCSRLSALMPAPCGSSVADGCNAMAVYFMTASFTMLTRQVH